MLIAKAELRTLLDGVPPELCTAETAEAVMAAMNGFESAKPTLGARLGVIGLEFRLNRDPRVDVSVPLARQDRVHVEVHGYAGPHSDKDATQSAWHSVLSLCRWWNRTDAVLGADRLLWLEFDVDRAVRTVPPTPNVLVQFKAESSKEALDPRRQDLYFRSLGRILRSEGMDASIEKRFAECRNVLPNGAYVRFVGAFLGRASSGVRLCVAGFRGGLESWLRNLGWRGAEVLDDCMSELACASPRVTPQIVNVDIGPDGEILPCVGIDFRFGEWSEVSKGAGGEFLARLVRRGLALGDKVEALMRFPQNVDMFFDGKNIGRVWKVHHVKVQLDEDGMTDAKAYAGQTVARYPDYPLSTSVVVSR